MAETTTTTTTRAYGTQVITKVRKVVSIYDEAYFCNRSWTLSFSMNTKSWVAFHSYLPNCYVKENESFYSIIKHTCQEFDFVAGVIVPATTTTSTTRIPTTTTTSTFAPVDCRLAGYAELNDCALEGIAIQTTESPCIRPNNLTVYQLVIGYYYESIYHISTGSKEEACAAGYILDEEPEAVSNLMIAEGQGIFVGAEFYQHNGTDDCTCVPDGWYFLVDTVGEVFRIEDCVIAEIAPCIEETSTTTTSTSTSSTTTTTTTIIINCGDPFEQRYLPAYPYTQEVILGTALGTTYLYFNAVNIPDRYIVMWDGSVVIDTGYVGDAAYDFGGITRNAFKTALLGKTDPITTNTYPDLVTYPDDGYPRVTVPGTGVYSFYKTTDTPESAFVNVYAPMDGTIWGFTLECPFTTTTTTTAEPTTTTTSTSSSTTTTTTEVPTTTTTTTGEPTTTTTSTSTTTTTTTIAPLVYQECDVFLLQNNNKVYHYRPSTETYTYLFTGSGISSIAFNVDAALLFISDSTGLKSYAMDVSNLYNITFYMNYGKEKTYTGLVAIGENNLIGVVGTTVDNILLSVNSHSITSTYNIDRTCYGDVIYNPTNEHLTVVTTDGINTYASEYDASTKVAEASLFAGTYNAKGLYQGTGNLEVVVNVVIEADVKVYDLIGGGTVFSHSLGNLLNIISTAQDVNCVNSFLPTTTSTTSTSTSTTSTTSTTSSTTTSTTSSTTTTTTTIIATICDDCDPFFEDPVSTTTTTTTLLPEQLGACDVIILTNDNKIYTYKPAQKQLTYRYTIGSAVTNIASTYTKLWLLDDINNRLIEMNIDYNDMASYSFSRYIGGITRSLVGMIAISNTTIIGGTDRTVYQYDISGGTAVETILFNIETGRSFTGDLVYNEFYNRYILSNSNIFGNNYISEYNPVTNEKTGEYNVPTANETIKGIYEYINLHFIKNGTNSVVYAYSGGVLTTFDTFTGVNVLATSQYYTCVTRLLPEYSTTSTSTTSSTTTTSTTIAPTTTTTTTGAPTTTTTSTTSVPTTTTTTTIDGTTTSTTTLFPSSTTTTTSTSSTTTTSTTTIAPTTTTTTTIAPTTTTTTTDPSIQYPSMGRINAVAYNENYWLLGGYFQMGANAYTIAKGYFPEANYVVLVYDNNNADALQRQLYYLWSADGDNWYQEKVSSLRWEFYGSNIGEVHDLAWSGSGWVAVGNTPIATSSNGETWTTRTSPISNTRFVVWNGNRWMVGNANAQTTYTGIYDYSGINWYSGNTVYSISMRSLATNGAQWITFGEDGISGNATIKTSNDLNVWITRYDPEGLGWCGPFTWDVIPSDQSRWIAPQHTTEAWEYGAVQSNNSGFIWVDMLLPSAFSPDNATVWGFLISTTRYLMFATTTSEGSGVFKRIGSDNDNWPQMIVYTPLFNNYMFVNTNHALAARYPEFSNF